MTSKSPNRWLRRFALWAMCAILFVGCGLAQAGFPNHTVQAPEAKTVSVEENVELEVLDWGGEGRPIVFLAGLGRTAHDFDDLAPKFTKSYRVIGITRRGYGQSSKPAATDANYSADRLGDDVLAVMNALKLERPVLVGHSFAGEEMSSVANRHSEKIAGLVYLDAAEGFALYDRDHGHLVVDLNTLRRTLDQWNYAANVDVDEQLTKQVLQSLPVLQKGLEAHLSDLEALSPKPPALPYTNESAVFNAIMRGERKFTEIRVPVLAIFASPPEIARNPSPEAKAMAEAYTAEAARQSAAFERAVPAARVIRLPYANHFVWRSNERDVVSAMNAFLSGLK